MKKVEFEKLSPRDIAKLDFKGDLRVQSRIRAGLAETLQGGPAGKAIVGLQG